LLGGPLCLLSETTTFPSHEATRPISFEFNTLTDGFRIVTFTFAVIFAHERASSCSSVNFIKCFVYPRTRPKYPSYIPPTTAATPPTSVSVATTIVIQQFNNNQSPFDPFAEILFPAFFLTRLDNSATYFFPLGSASTLPLTSLSLQFF
jgi:hypothetical protein